jgi:2-polyprenyl-3-methyl-5-hydroxy-6-metoxy-1,4-benzoquinol methylase
LAIPPATEHSADALVERLSKAFVGAFDLGSIYIGDRLGLYAELERGGARTAPELAAELGLHERYVREWLEQQAVTGLLVVDDPAQAAHDRRFSLPAEHAEVLLDADSLRLFGPNGRAVVAMIGALPEVVEAFRSGGGVPYARYGADMRESVAAMNRPLYLNLLGSEWLPAIADVHERLQGLPPARVADIACGAGWSTISLARAYPNVIVDGFDLDEASIEQAQGNLAASDVAARVTFQSRDAGDPALAGRYDLVTIFEALHDMSDPVGVLRSMRGLLAADGSVLVADERAAERFNAPGDELERFLYGAILHHCLPVGMADQPSAGTGTVMRPDTVRAYADKAGFATTEILPIENRFWRFFRLRP